MAGFRARIGGAVGALTALLLGFSGIDAAAASQPFSAAAVVNTGQYVEGTDAAAFMFDPLTVHRIDLTVPQASIDYMNEHASGAYPGSHGEYQPAKMVFTRISPTDPKVKVSTTANMDIGIRLKGGWGSARPLGQRAAFKLKMNYSVKGQNLFGLKKLTLNNMVQDPSMVHEVLGYRLFRAVGVPAARAGYVRVYVNGQDYGLRLNLETYDDVAFSKRFTSTAHLYEGAYWQDLIPGQAEALQVDEGDPNNKSDILALAAVNNVGINSTSANTWFNEVQKIVDLNEFLNEWAVERYLAHWDGYSGEIKNNYYVHFTNEGIATMLPSGIDQSSQGVLGFTTTLNTAQMFQLCMVQSTCKGLYYGAVNKVRDAAVRLNLKEMSNDLLAALDAHVKTDPMLEVGYWGWPDWVRAAGDWHISRPATAIAATNSNSGSNLKIDYAYNSWNVGDVFKPTVTLAGGARPTFAVVNGANVCSIDATSGDVTVLAADGWCRVSARVGTTTGWGSSLNYFTFFGGKLEGAVNLNQVSALTFDTVADLDVSASSAATVQLSATGPCVIEGEGVRATAGTGICVVTAVAPGDGTYFRASTTLQIPLKRAVNTTWMQASGFAKLPTKIPAGGKLTFAKSISKVSGNCSVNSKTVKALAASGYCTITGKAWTDTNFSYKAQTVRLTIVTGKQRLQGSITKPGTHKFSSSFRLAPASSLKTNWGNTAVFKSDYNCSVSQEGSYWIAYSLTGSTCSVKLTVAQSFGLSGLSYSWTLKPAQ